MANDFGDITNSLLVHDVVDDLTTDLEPILGLATNFGEMSADGLNSIRAARPGTTVKIKDFSAPFTPYTVDGSVGYAAPEYDAKADISVTLPSAITAVSMSLTAAEYRVLIGAPRESLAYNLLRTKVNEMMLRGLKEKMVTDFFAIITAEDYANETVSAASTFTRSKEVEVDTALFTRKLMSRSNATAILHPTTYKEWAVDHIAVHTNTGQDQAERLLTGGNKSSVTPLTFWRTNVAMPTDSGRGLAFTKTAALFVARIPDEPTYDRDPVGLTTVVDPESGISFLSRVWKDAKKALIQFDLAIIYKFQKLQGEALERIVATATT
jgi:hypothetical protein